MDHVGENRSYLIRQDQGYFNYIYYLLILALKLSFFNRNDNMVRVGNRLSLYAYGVVIYRTTCPKTIVIDICYHYLAYQYAILIELFR